MMPPRTRTCKQQKENLRSPGKPKLKNAGKVTKVLRKALADKTNSASDENCSVDVKTNKCDEVMERPKRVKKLPPRFADNETLKALVSSKPISPVKKVSLSNVSQTVNITETPIKPAGSVIRKTSKYESKDGENSGTGSPKQCSNSSIIANRPKRVHRLPSRFEENSSSPVRTVQPCYASTPILHLKENTVARVQFTESTVKHDTNNNPSNSTKKSPIPKKILPKAGSPGRNNGVGGMFKPGARRFSLKILGSRAVSPKKCTENLAVYEFTFDPSKEPQVPIKKKRKKTVAKKPAPKNYFLKQSYQQNVSKTLQNLKDIVSKKNGHKVTSVAIKTKLQLVPAAQDSTKFNRNLKRADPSTSDPATNLLPKINKLAQVGTPNEGISLPVRNLGRKVIPTTHRDHDGKPMEPLYEDNNKDYSPQASPNHVPEFSINSDIPLTNHQNAADPPINPPAINIIRGNDPLNLRNNDLSFFDDEPVASSSFNVSVRHPEASPWRVQCQELPSRYSARAYARPGSTSAYENNIDKIISNANYKTNEINVQQGCSEPVIHQDDASKWKQTSIISFFEEVIKKNAAKKKKPVSPVKNNSIFDVSDAQSILMNSVQELTDTPAKPDQTQKKLPLNESRDKSVENENIATKSQTPLKNLNSQTRTESPIKKPKKKKSVGKYFGFDDSEDCDQENVSPNKNLQERRQIRPLRTRTAVLREINEKKGPTRLNAPASTRTPFATNSDLVNRLFEEIKTVGDAPLLPENKVGEEANKTLSSSNDSNLSEQMSSEVDKEDTQPLGLFEDVDFILPIKPVRKSYAKAKKVTFRQRSVSSDGQFSGNESSEEEGSEVAEPEGFTVPSICERKAPKRKKVQKMSKKEAEEADAWAAGFNSMLEEVDDFPLTVE